MNVMVPLWCKSNFSFLEGASHPEELVLEAQRLALPAIAITDRDGVYGVVRAFTASKESGQKLIIGSEITVRGGEKLVLLCENRRGYAQLCQLISKGRLRSEKGSSEVTWQEVCAHAEGLIALCQLGGETEPGLYAAQLREAFSDRLYVMLPRHQESAETRREARLRRRAEQLSLPLVAVQEVLYHHLSRRPLQDILTCIRHGVTLTNAGRLTKPNTQHALQPFAGRLFADAPQAVIATHEIAQRCQFSMSELRYRYPSERLPNGMTSMEWLRELTYRGARDRYGGELPAEVRAQIEKELALINQLDYPGYFLTMWELVEFCRQNEILCQGRGSAANSVVCYCLKVTAIDPVRMGLLFERFISIERPEPPDIDLDIGHERREEVIQHVYEKYGRTHSAMVANFIRYRSRSALRDVGKVLGFSETSLDRMAKLQSYFDDMSTLPAGTIDVSNRLHQELLTRVNEIIDFPRHLSIHPGGFLLGHEPISDLVPIENGTMEDRTVIQWDKRDVDELSLFKVDLLGLGALTQLDMCFRLLKQHRQQDLSMATVPAEDPATYQMLQRADTVGVFQIESRAQMSMLPRLKPKTFYDLVVEVSLVRPGPITGGMVHPYLRRRNGEEPIDYPHECLIPVLQKTLGIPLFQEQVMRLAVVAADYTPGEADQLRRDMAAWRSSGRIEQHHERLISRMQKKGIALEFAERVFQQIRGFGEYGFPESHAASFALICYATSWFRCHHLDIFTCALLNAQPMGFYSAATIIDDAKRHGLVVLPIDARCSEWNCTLEQVGSSTEGLLALRMGLRYISGFSEAEAHRVIAARHADSLEAFAHATQLNEKALRALSESNALHNFVHGGSSNGLALRDRRQALWDTSKLSRQKALVAAKVADTATLPLPLLEREQAPLFSKLTAFEDISWDYASMRHSTSGHVLQTIRAELTAQKLLDARSILQTRSGRRIRCAGLVICRQRPGTASGVVFMTLEDETGFINVVVWTKVFEKFSTLIKSTSFLGIVGRIQNEQNVVHLIAESFFVPKLSSALTSTMPSVGSRDFH